MFRRFFAAAVATVTLSLMGAASVSAQPQQNGLININVSDNVVQVPVSIAANVCDVTVAVLVADLRDEGETTCDALAESGAEATVERGGGGARQDGLVNVNLENNTIQIPIAAAANICDVDVVLLATEILLNDATACTARAGSTGIVFPPE
jgi:hypothetical protein